MGRKLVVRKSTANGQSPSKPKITRKAKKTEQPVNRPGGRAIEIPGFPKSEGPPSVANGGGKSIYKSTTMNDHCIYLDEGALRWLWESIEHQALDHHRRYSGLLPELTTASERALTEVRRVGHLVFPPPRKVNKSKAGKKIVKKAGSKPTGKKKLVVKRKA